MHFNVNKHVSAGKDKIKLKLSVRVVPNNLTRKKIIVIDKSFISNSVLSNKQIDKTKIKFKKKTNENISSDLE